MYYSEPYHGYDLKLNTRTKYEVPKYPCKETARKIDEKSDETAEPEAPKDKSEDSIGTETEHDPIMEIIGLYQFPKEDLHEAPKNRRDETIGTEIEPDPI